MYHQAPVCENLLFRFRQFHSLLLESEERIPWLQGLNRADIYVSGIADDIKTTGNGHRHVLVCLKSYFVLRQSNKQANTQYKSFSDLLVLVCHQI